MQLPGRDRKVWRRALKRTNNHHTGNLTTTTPPVVPFSTMRAWFGSIPEGVDTNFRHAETCQVCTVETNVAARCSAIVALHPDEATDGVVDMAIKLQVPLVVVPCCVFCRLFPNRLRGEQLVSTYEDLLKYLADKHDGIRATKLPFEGANVALWATF